MARHARDWRYRLISPLRHKVALFGGTFAPILPHAFCSSWQDLNLARHNTTTRSDTNIRHLASGHGERSKILGQVLGHERRA